MIDMTSVAAAGTAIQTVVDLVTKLKEISGDISEMETQQLILEIQSNALDLKAQNIDLKEAVNNLRTENSELQIKLETRESFEFNGEFYIKKDSEDVDKNSFCPACLDGKGKMARLSLHRGGDGMICTVCHTHYPKGFYSQKASYDSINSYD